MRNVTRLQEPPLFQRKARGWTMDLLNKIRAEGKASNYYFKRYNQKSEGVIRKELEDRLLGMYSEMCCYCEGKTPRVQGEIEHLKPKKKFPDKTYDWNNLHWICGACNGIKLDQYDDAYPILDPSDTELVSNHIEIKTAEHLNRIWLSNSNNSRRGQTTIWHAGLNRDDLRKARFDIFWRTMALIQQTRKPMVNPQTLEMTQEKLKTLYLGEFGFVTTVVAAFVTTALKYEDL